MDITYSLASDGIYRPSIPLFHREEEYAQSGYDTLWRMQQRHFWYRGRHRFLLAGVERYISPNSQSCATIDLGGGVGGWVRFLRDHHRDSFRPLALADSSLAALRMAGPILPADVARYQIDLMNLGWNNCWDVAFLLDVIEHLPDDRQVLVQARKALKPGGLLFITTPALSYFWSYNDVLAQHLRRYNREDFIRLADETGFELCDVRYFMFFLSPIYWLARRRPGIATLNDTEKRELARRSHQVPAEMINTILTAIFGAETPLGHKMHFPWGTSILSVLRKPG